MVFLFGGWSTLLLANAKKKGIFPVSKLSLVDDEIDFGGSPRRLPPYDDLLRCELDDLVTANDSQLYEILQELKRTQFFRNFIVDLDHRCPLQSWNRNGEHGDEEFECGGDDSASVEEKEGPALCTVQGGAALSDPFSSSALLHLQQSGFTSQSQQEAFSWKDPTDTVITELQPQQPPISDEPTAEDEDEFWKDMCRAIGHGPTTQTVNLVLNPERNTGYNGTHIWRAIYEENCLEISEAQHYCLEERVLYRLLSGLHASTTISIAQYYYPPSRKKNRKGWEPNPQYFMEKFQNHPEHLHNLHFAFAVLLRALRKASTLLYEYPIVSGEADTGYEEDVPSNQYNNGNHSNSTSDEKAEILLRRLLDSSILQSCAPVFDGFDESRMFAEDDDPTSTSITMLQHNFKGVFHNISSILDCVQCQQCKLHGKLAMLGYGVALKILLCEEMPTDLQPNEVVGFINTIVKFSESLKHVQELTELYHQEIQSSVEDPKITQLTSPLAENIPLSPLVSPPGTNRRNNAHDTAVENGIPSWLDAVVAAIAELGRQNRIDWETEARLVNLALQKQSPEMILLAKHYQSNMPKLSQLLLQNFASCNHHESSNTPDAIVIGSGLAGLTASLHILDRGGRVVIIEKEKTLGGNSNKASSGINAVAMKDDSLDLFRNDTHRSAGTSARDDLIDTLVQNSRSAVDWLMSRVGVDLSLLSQLGGHSTKRTHRPNNGMAGAEIIYNLQKAVKEYVPSGRVQIITDTRVTKLLEENGSVVGVEYIPNNRSIGDENLGNATSQILKAPNVILATGGFAADRSPHSYLAKHRPEFLKMPTTAGAFSTGDGISLALELGAGTVDMDKIQVHPTGWVDPADPDNTSKVLAAELMRGVGGILVNSDGQRFCNELGTRAYVTKKMLEHDANFQKTGKWNVESKIPTFSLILSSAAAQNGKKHVDLYTHKGLLVKLEGVGALAKWMGLPKSTVVSSLRSYQKDATKGTDKFGKSAFRGVPDEDLETEVFYAGTVTPVLHYCMGGISIDAEGNVLNASGEIIHGLHAAGEVSGGVHGVNRLAGNSLLECTVYGTIVGKKIPIRHTSFSSFAAAEPPSSSTPSQANKEKRKITKTELSQHNTPEDCWVAIHGVVYDLTDFADEHPAGAASVHELAGQDGTEAFAAVHNVRMLEDFDEEIKGEYAS
jgi:flavocytochrome c